METVYCSKLHRDRHEGGEPTLRTNLDPVVRGSSLGISPNCPFSSVTAWWFAEAGPKHPVDLPFPMYRDLKELSQSELE